MKLRNKIILSVSIIWILFLAITYAGTRYFLIQNFLQLEQNRANLDLTRVDQALDKINYSLYTFTTDWAHWNNSYRYMSGQEPSFVADNINRTAMIDSNVNLLSYWDKRGKLVIGAAVDTKNEKLTSFPTGLQRYVFPGSQLLSRNNPNNDMRGYILLPQGIMMVAAAAVTNSDKTQPAVGAMVTGRYLSAEILDQIKKITQLNVNIMLPEEIERTPALSDVFHTLSGTEGGHLSQPINDTVLKGYALIRDVNGNPIGMIGIQTPRVIYMTGIKAVHYYLASFVILGILFSILMLWLLRNLIIKRLEGLEHAVVDISNKSNFTNRVSVGGNDELSSLSGQINSMLDIIQSSHDKLENRVKKRTQELQKTNAQLQEEIAERKSVEKELIIHKEHLVRLAHYDTLTSLPNRVFFNEMLGKTLNHARRHKKNFAILLIDLDRFKNINDAFGHATGDLVLKEITQRLAAVIRAGDVLARLGADEFIILLNDMNHPKIVSTVAEKILQIAAHPLKIHANEFFVTASIGISVFPEDGNSLEELLKNADTAMYKAKRAGGGVFHYFQKDMHIQAFEHIQLEAALRRAISNNEFVLHYQPKLDLKDGSLISVEALVRWENSELGLVNPSQFIPLAEETGLIMQIGEWVLREACRANKSWQDQGYQPIQVSVNLSPKQFRRQDIAQLVATVLADTKLPPEHLEIEITETAIMEDVDTTISRLNDIKKMGVHIAIDDFGTGYTSISYLKQFPIDVLKIDQTFIKGIPDNANDAAIVSAVIALAHTLGIEVVAEGVETPEQLQYLADQNCDIVQGYYLSRPLPEAKIILQLVKRGL